MQWKWQQKAWINPILIQQIIVILHRFGGWTIGPRFWPKPTKSNATLVKSKGHYQKNKQKSWYKKKENIGLKQPGLVLQKKWGLKQLLGLALAAALVAANIGNCQLKVPRLADCKNLPFWTGEGVCLGQGIILCHRQCVQSCAMYKTFVFIATNKIN